MARSHAAGSGFCSLVLPAGRARPAPRSSLREKLGTGARLVGPRHGREEIRDEPPSNTDWERAIGALRHVGLWMWVIQQHGGPKPCPGNGQANRFDPTGPGRGTSESG